MSVRRPVYRPRRNWRAILGWTFMALVVMVAFASLGAYIGMRTSGFGHRVEILTPPFDGKQVVYILAMGEDDTRLTQKRPRGLTDTIILLRVDFPNKYVAAISIPRDTRIELDGYGKVKVNSAHVLGGPYLTSLAVEQLTGIKPDYYVKTNLEGFRKSVDILGGIEIDVEKNMKYNDNWGNLHINLKKGRQLLNGEQAMGYVRFRHDALGDITRMERQQKFLKVFVATMLSPKKLPRLPFVVKALMDNVETSMTVKDALHLAEFARDINLDEVKMATLPATPEYIGGISYMIQDVEKTQEVVQELFFPKPPMPKVQVLNGSGIPGAAQKVADALEQYGYQITDIGNAGSFEYSSTEVIYYKESDSGVSQLASIVNSGKVTQHPDESAPPADMTVIVGRDCSLVNSGS